MWIEGEMLDMELRFVEYLLGNNMKYLLWVGSL